MKKIALIAALAALTSAGTLAAQNPGPPPGGMGRGPGGRGGPPGMMMDQMLFKGITLSEAQKAQLKSLRDAERQQMEAQRGQGDAGRAEMDAIRDARQKGDTVTANRLMAEQRAKMDARRDQQVTSLRGILTADQTAQFDANVAEMKKMEGQRGQGRGFGRGPRPPQS